MTIITTIGRITKDLELKTSDKGCVYVNFSLAVNEGFGDNQKATYYECTVFNGDAERLIKAKAKKGSLLQVSGKFGTSEFTRNDGTPGYSLKITDAKWSYIPGASSQKDTNGNNGVANGYTQVLNQPPEYYPDGDYNGATNLDNEAA